MENKEELAVWAIVELMGHLKLSGKLTEEEKFGAKMGRIDIPNHEDGFTTQHFGGASIYRITYVGEAEARAVAKQSQPRPVSIWEMPKQLAAAEDDPSNDDDFDEDDA